jgi:hypothetical protein
MTTEIARTLAWYREYFATPAGIAYLRRRFVPSEYVRLVAWLRARAPFNRSAA